MGGGGWDRQEEKKRKKKKEKTVENSHVSQAAAAACLACATSFSFTSLWGLGPRMGRNSFPAKEREKVKTSLTDYSPRLPCNEHHVDSQATTSNEGPVSPINRLTGVTLHWCNSSTIKKEQWQSETEVANDCAIVSLSTKQTIPAADSPGQIAAEPLMLGSILKYEWLFQEPQS